MGKTKNGKKKSKVVQLLEEANSGDKSTTPSTGTSSAESSPEERRRKIPPPLVGGLTFPDRPRPREQQQTLNNYHQGFEEVSSDEDTLHTQSTAMSQALPAALPPVLQGLLPAHLTTADFESKSTDDKLLFLFNSFQNLASMIVNMCNTTQQMCQETRNMVRQAALNKPEANSDPVENLVRAQIEKEERDGKKTNFVVYGLEEKDADTDTKFIEAVIEKAAEGNPDFPKSPNEYIHEVVRMGDGKKRDGTPSPYPRLLKVKLNDVHMQRKIVTSQKKILPHFPEMSKKKEEIRYSQYFRNDLTLMQRQKHAELVRERNGLNENLAAGEPRYRVFNDKLVRDRGFPPRE